MPSSRLFSISSTFAVTLLVAACGNDTAPVTAPHVVRPPCSAPAPLLGSYSVPGYIVVFHDTIDAVAETSRLAQRYDFTPKFVYSAALQGFAAVLPDSTVAALRCEPSVESIEFNQPAHIA